MQGLCSICNDGKTKRLAKRNPPICGYHYSIAQQTKAREKNKDLFKKVHVLRRTRINYKRKKTGELAIFKSIWDSTENHTSYINGEPIPVFDVSCFAHVLPKGKNKYPLFKLYKKNIVLITKSQHFQWDNGLRSKLKELPVWNKMFELETELKDEYKNFEYTDCQFAKCQSLATT